MCMGTGRILQKQAHTGGKYGYFFLEYDPHVYVYSFTCIYICIYIYILRTIIFTCNYYLIFVFVCWEPTNKNKNEVPCICVWVRAVCYKKQGNIIQIPQVTHLFCIHTYMGTGRGHILEKVVLNFPKTYACNTCVYGKYCYILYTCMLYTFTYRGVCIIFIYIEIIKSLLHVMLCMYYV